MRAGGKGVIDRGLVDWSAFESGYGRRQHMPCMHMPTVMPEIRPQASQYSAGAKPREPRVVTSRSERRLNHMYQNSLRQGHVGRSQLLYENREAFRHRQPAPKLLLDMMQRMHHQRCYVCQPRGRAAWCTGRGHRRPAHQLKFAPSPQTDFGADAFMSLVALSMHQSLCIGREYLANQHDAEGRSLTHDEVGSMHQRLVDWLLILGELLRARQIVVVQLQLRRQASADRHVIYRTRLLHAG